jgi:hypothetical protein
MTTNSNDRLRPRLAELQTQLQQNLEDVCETEAVEKVDTGELIRIEETLSIAANAAKEAVSLRRKIHLDRDAGGGASQDAPRQLGDAP